MRQKCLLVLKISHFKLFPYYFHEIISIISDKTPICWESKVLHGKKVIPRHQSNRKELLKLQGHVDGMLSNWGQKAYQSFLWTPLQWKQKTPSQCSLNSVKLMHSDSCVQLSLNYILKWGLGIQTMHAKRAPLQELKKRSKHSIMPILRKENLSF